MKPRKAMVEAALFMASEPLSLERLSKITRSDSEQIKDILHELKNDLDSPDHGIHLVESQQGYQLRVKADFMQNVHGLTPYKDLSRGLLKVLALVAYKQPITQSEIVKVIGNRAYAYVKTLEEKGLIRTVKSGRTKALIATNEFLNYFGVQDMEDIKKMLGDVDEGNNKP